MDTLLQGETDFFELIETMYGTREDGIRHLERHEYRLRRSSESLGFPFSTATFRKLVHNRCTHAPAKTPCRVRAALNKTGEFNCIVAPLQPLAKEAVDVLLAPEQGFSNRCTDDRLLRHKTTYREEYDAAIRTAEAQGAFDMLFFNERGELTEGARSNVFLKLEGRWWTPPLSSGLLPGIMRSVILDDAAWDAGERVLMRTDLARMDELMVCNALRGPLKAHIRSQTMPHQM